MPRLTTNRCAAVLAFAALLAAQSRFSRGATPTNYIGPDNGLWTNAANWSAGVPNTAGFDALIGNPSPLTVQLNASQTINTLSLSAPDTLSLLSTLTIAGPSLTNTGTLVFNATANQPTLTFASDSTLSGGGVILMNSSSGSITGATGANGARLTTDNLISGQGLIGKSSFGALKISNSGTITATAGTLSLQAANATDGFYNTGALRADGGTLVLGANTYNNAGGLIEAVNGSRVSISSGSTIIGGTISAPTGQVDVLATLQNVSLQGNIRVPGIGTSFTGVNSNAGTLSLLANPILSFSGMLANSGTITFDPASAVTLSLAANATLSGGGTVLLNGSASSISTGSGFRLTTDNLILGRGFIGGGFFLLTNSGTIAATTGLLTLQVSNATNGVYNTGALRAAGGTLALGASTYNNAGGIIEALDGSLLTLSGGTIIGGNLRSSGTGSVAFSGTTTLQNIDLAGVFNATANNTTIAIAGTVNSTAQISAHGGTLSGTFNNSGVWSVTSTLAITAPSLLSGGGTLVLTNGASGVPTFTNNSLILGQGNFLTNLANAGTIVATAGTLALLPNSCTNTGLLRADGGLLALNVDVANTGGLIESVNGSPVAIGGAVTGGTLSFSNTPVAFSGSLRDLSILGNATLSASSAATLRGNITASGNISLLSTFNISSALTLSGGGTYTLGNATFNGSGPLTNLSQLAGSGSINLPQVLNAGTLTASGGTLSLAPNSCTNTGILRVAPGGTLVAANISNAGLLDLQANAAFVGSLAGGTLTAADSATIAPNGTLGNLTIIGNPSIVGSGLAGSILGTLSFAGDLTYMANMLSGFPGSATLTGGGRFLMNASSALLSDSSMVLTNASANTIAGQGSLFMQQLFNAGIITATVGTLSLGGPGPSFLTNTGTLGASGGVLAISGNIVNTGGIIQVASGSSLTVAGSITGGSLAVAPGGSVSISAGLISVTFTNAGVMTFPSGNIPFAGTLNNTATLQFLSGSTLTLSADSAFTGGGSISLTNAVIKGDSSKIFRLTSDNFISGSGTIGQTQAFGLTNNGTISATTGVLNLFITTAGTGSTWINTGTLRASGGSLSLHPSNGSISNSGVIEALFGSTILSDLNNVLTINGGTLQAAGGTILLANSINSNIATTTVANASISATAGGVILLANASNSSFFADATSQIKITHGTLTAISNYGLLVLESHQTSLTGLGLSGAIVNLGVITVASASGAGAVTAIANTTISGTGAVTLAGGSFGGAVGTAFRLTNLSTIIGNGTLTAPLTNAGLVTSTGPGISFATGAYINTGNMIASGSTLSLGRSNGPVVSLDNTGGTIQIFANSTVSLQGTLTAGSIAFANASTSIFQTSGATLTNLALLGDGNMLSESGLTLNGTTSFTGHVNFRASTSIFSIQFPAAATLSGSGTLTLAGAPTLRSPSGGTRLVNAITLDGSANIGGGILNITNTGSIIANNTVGMTIQPTSFTSTGILRADGAPLTFLNSTYAISGTLETKNNGTLNFNAGTFNISAPITLGGGSANFNATGPGAQNIAAISGPGKLTIGVNSTLTSDSVFTSSLAISGTQVIRPSAPGASASDVTALSLANDTTGAFTATLDLTNNSFILQSNPVVPGDKAAKLAFLHAALLSGADGGDWFGKGITSSTVAADQSATGSHMATLALLDNADLGLTTFAGQTVDSNSLLITTALLGDANLDGIVNPTDLLIWSHNFNNAGNVSVATGDFNNDGVVNPTDLLIWAHNFNNTASGLPFVSSAGVLGSSGIPGDNQPLNTTTPVPEPASLLLLLPLVLLQRRRRSIQ